MANGSRGATTAPKTFKTWGAAKSNAKQLLNAGKITKTDYNRISQKAAKGK